MKYLIILISSILVYYGRSKKMECLPLSILTEDQNEYDLSTECWIIFCFHTQQTTPLNCKLGHYLTKWTTLGHITWEYNLQESTFQETQTHDIIEIFWALLCFISQWTKLRSNPDDRKDKFKNKLLLFFLSLPIFSFGSWLQGSRCYLKPFWR